MSESVLERAAGQVRIAIDAPRYAEEAFKREVDATALQNKTVEGLRTKIFELESSLATLKKEYNEIAEERGTAWGRCHTAEAKLRRVQEVLGGK